LEVLEEEKNNKIRLVEINTYYGDKYAEHSQLMKIVIFTLIPVIILAFLNNKGILPRGIYFILIIIASAIGGYFFWIKFASIITRDNMNYQEYNWQFDPNNVQTAASSTTTDPWASSSMYGTCIGNACCSGGLTYDASLNQCVLPTTSANATNANTTYTSNTPNATNTTNTSTESFITESMINSVLTKKEDGKFKPDINLRQPEAFNNR
jgi:hypothetical protein